MSSTIPVSRGRDRHARALAAPQPLGALEPVPTRILQHVVDLRARVAFGIDVDTSHATPVTAERAGYLLDLERAVRTLDERNMPAWRALWAGAHAAALHDPRVDPHLGTCPHCDRNAFVTTRPGERLPLGRLTDPAPGPPRPHSGIAEEVARLPRLHGIVALDVARNAGHSDTSPDAVLAIRVLTGLEERLVRDHLALTLTLIGSWTALEASWVRDPALVHVDGCNHCWRAKQRVAAR